MSSAKENTEPGEEDSSMIQDEEEVPNQDQHDRGDCDQNKEPENPPEPGESHSDTKESEEATSVSASVDSPEKMEVEKGEAQDEVHSSCSLDPATGEIKGTSLTDGDDDANHNSGEENGDEFSAKDAPDEGPKDAEDELIMSADKGHDHDDDPADEAETSGEGTGASPDKFHQEPMDQDIEAGSVDLSTDGEAVEGQTPEEATSLLPEDHSYSGRRVRSSRQRETHKRKSLEDYITTEDEFSKVTGSGKKKKMPFSPSAGAIKKTSFCEEWIKPFNEGWTREVVKRNTYDEGPGVRPADVYYRPPKGKKLRSLKEIATYIQKVGSTLSVTDFTYFKGSIYKEPFEVVRTAGNVKCFGSSKKVGRPPKIPKSPISPKPSTRTSLSPKAYKSPLSFSLRHKSVKPVKVTPQKSPTATTFKLKITPKTSEKMPVAKSPSSSSTSSTPMSASTVIHLNKVVFTEEKTPTTSASRVLLVKTPASTCTVVTPVLPVKAATPQISAPVVHSKLSVVPKRAWWPNMVAKKHTAKRSRSSNVDHAAKRIRIDGNNKGLTGTETLLCGMECPGRHGIPPSLTCDVCMCMFHPECVGHEHMAHNRGFVCRSCTSVKSSLEPSSNASGSSLPMHPSALPLTSLPSLPPPLKISSIYSQSSTSVSMPSLPPPPLLRYGAPLSTAHTAVSSAGQAPLPMPPALHPGGMGHALPVSAPTGPLGMPPLQAMGHSAAFGTSLASVALASSGSAVLPSSVGPYNASLPPAPPPVAQGPPLIRVSLPSNMNTEKITGQVLTLPGRLTDKLDFSRPLSLNLNGQKISIPPNCIVSTKEGMRVFLPPGVLPNTLTKGPSYPLEARVPREEGNNQTLCISAMDSIGRADDTPREAANASPPPARDTQSPTEVGDKDPSPAKPTRASSRRLRQVQASMCHFQRLHVGFDCMLSIFQYLSVPDLLRTSQACRTWRRVSTQHCLWKNVRLRDVTIKSWEGMGRHLDQHGTRRLDLRGIQHLGDRNRTWQLLHSVLDRLMSLRQLEFGQCPASIIHAVSDKLANLQTLTAEFLTDSMVESEMWSTTTKLDIGKLANLKQLVELRLRGLCGITLPVFSFNGGLPELGALAKLKILSVTTLRDQLAEDFNFIGNLTGLEVLEIGDCSEWTAQTYEELGKLKNLHTLQLASGGQIPDIGAGAAIAKLTKLQSLELIKFAISEELANAMHTLKSLTSLSIWPDTEEKTELINSNAMLAVSQMPSLKQLDWGIMVDTVAPNGDNNGASTNGNGGASNPAMVRSDTIPFLPMPLHCAGVPAADLVPEYVSINQLVERVSSHLPDAKIRVFKVPITSAPKQKRTPRTKAPL